jgi:leukotriene-A4 hydrolase
VVVTSPDKLDECKWELEADTETFITTIEVFESAFLEVDDFPC